MVFGVFGRVWEASGWVGMGGEGWGAVGRGGEPPTTPQTPSNSAVSWNVDACTILPQPLNPLNPLSGIPEGSIDSIGDPLGGIP